MKKCPFCAEKIQNEAVYCRYCGHNLPASPSSKPIFVPTADPIQTRSTPKSSKSRSLRFYIVIGIIIISGISKYSNYLDAVQFQKEHPKPKTVIHCSYCKNSIPIYDSWRTTREIVAYAKNGEECEVSANYTKSVIATDQPKAFYQYIDESPHLYVRCPSGHGFVYTYHTTFGMDDK